MTRWYEPTPDKVELWHDWLAERPPAVRAIAERFPPWKLFRLETTGQCVVVRSVSEDGTVTVKVSARFNEASSMLDVFMPERQVFGIDPSTLAAWAGEKESMSRE